ncbi:MAG: hypothetical protein Tp152SUR00d2C52646391_5 [Prokaryotic dsDNA virus sp.]|nr:MAG: hypothetical protein Tp152SUR00d2C52646391_5 [Prokaryotic dsDNA virus sp.]|tara:strand:- start:210 stop:566 length:357 start_codon:yes stop_codon:yes gene_type:complete
MKVYLIWAVALAEEIDTTDRDRYIEKFPCAAKYEPFYLFPAEQEEVTALTCEVVDLSSKLLVESAEDKYNETDITYAEFDAMADELINQGFSGRAIVLSVAQGKYLKESRYPEPETGE